MTDQPQLWLNSGIRAFEVVRCRVTGHRGRFGVEVEVVTPASDMPAFIDFVNLTDSLEHPRPEDFPPIGNMLDAVALDFLPGGELRLAVVHHH
ncbi:MULTISPECIES: hypothetical protein [Streptomyces]|uniref:hypothetical protein n=1 Tax=Streptomyces TaxID=1883 RepID=UPI0018DF67D7|nr:MULTISPECIES: hypothetical protein [Streptomyces]MCZ4103708.1 hypothetical protein [Streptomyces sp. H39-C1]